MYRQDHYKTNAYECTLLDEDRHFTLNNMHQKMAAQFPYKVSQPVIRVYWLVLLISVSIFLTLIFLSDMTSTSKVLRCLPLNHQIILSMLFLVILKTTEHWTLISSDPFFAKNQQKDLISSDPFSAKNQQKDLKPQKFYSPGYNLLFEIIAIPSEAFFVSINEYVDACGIPR